MGEQIQGLNIDKFEGGILYEDYSLSGCYYLFSKDEWHSQSKKIRLAPLTKRQARAISRLLFANIKIFNKSRLNSLKSVIISQEKSKIELWKKIYWHNYQKGKFNRYEGAVLNKDEKHLQIKLTSGTLLTLNIPSIPSNIDSGDFLKITTSVGDMSNSGSCEYHSRLRGNELILPGELQMLMCNGLKNTRYFITKGLDGCLFLYTEEEFNLIKNKIKALGEMVGKFITSNFKYVNGYPKNGKVIIPKEFLAFASIKDKVTAIWLENRIEIWAREEWKQYISTVRNYMMKTLRGKVDKIFKNKIDIFFKESDKAISLPVSILPSGINKGDWLWIILSKKFLD